MQRLAPRSSSVLAVLQAYVQSAQNQMEAFRKGRTMFYSQGAVLAFPRMPQIYLSQLVYMTNQTLHGTPWSSSVVISYGFFLCLIVPSHLDAHAPACPAHDLVQISAPHLTIFTIFLRPRTCLSTLRFAGKRWRAQEGGRLIWKKSDHRQVPLIHVSSRKGHKYRAGQCT